MTPTRKPSQHPVLWCVGCMFAFVLVLGGRGAVAQEPRSAPAKNSSSSNAVAEPSSAEPQKKEAGQRPGFGAELAKESREAAGEDDTAQFKKSASVRFLAKFTGGDLQHAYWLAVGLNFAVVAGFLVWAGRKYLPGVFKDRTASIQKAMEEARRASEDANRRLSEIESRLSRLGDEIAAMTATAEKDVVEEEARIKAAAEADGRKIVESAEQEIAAAAKAARRDLTTYAADLAIALAKKQIHVDVGTDSFLVRSFADRLGSADDGGKN
jgi:F-type H+-transporting ATPase subunit b